MDDILKSYLMNCDLENLNESNHDQYEQLAKSRKDTEQYWRDRLFYENQSN